MNRRSFVQTLLATTGASALASEIKSEWGGPVIDTHLHLRRDPEACYTHMQGCGVTHALLLTSAKDEANAIAEMKKRPQTFARSVTLDPADPAADQTVRDALRQGAVSIGELKFHLALNSPEMRRLYDIAAETGAPVMMHIQDFPHFPGERPYNTGYPDFAAVLKAHPKTKFIGHGDLFWAHISADVPTDRGYPNGPIKPGGLTDRLLGDYPNLYGDLSANSGNNALSRDPDFARSFVVRHRTKLLFGSDCSCADGHGGGVSQGNNPEASRLAGKCVARATLTVLKSLSTPDLFRQVTWTNAKLLYRLDFPNT